MAKAWFVARGMLRLTLVVLACVLLAGLGYAAIVAWIVLLPPPAIR